jgi:hypothetical protein
MLAMKERGTRTRSTLGLAGFLLVLVAALGAQAQPPSFKLPGRKPDSKEPWDAFLGKAAHYAIGRAYRVQHPSRVVLLDPVDLYDIVDEGKLGDPERLPGRYLAALNEAVEPDKKLTGGTGFEGSLFLEFENGGALWQLSWRTPEPGVTLYRWSYRRKKPGASWKERAAQKAEELPREEIEQRGELAEQAIRAAYDGGEWPKGVQGQVYLPVDCR